jgi:SAM-dependent methyltransferase
MIATVQTLKTKYYPGGAKDGTLLFYSWLRKRTRNDFTALNIGAGPTADRKVKSLKGEVKRVIGIDIDKAVLENEDLDQSMVIEKNKFPFGDDYFDLAWADYVMEHVEDPMSFLCEVSRVLKPGASFFFRTPNKYHYVSLIGRMTPHWFHERVANRARGLAPDAHEPYPTYYRHNSRKEISDCARSAGFRVVELKFVESEPSYLVFNPLAFRIGIAYERFVNRYDGLQVLRSNIFGRLEK